MKNHYFVLGYFGYDSNQLDGQTIKTRSVYKLFQEKTQEDIFYYDTERLKRNKFSLILAVIKLCKSKELIYLPAHNNLKYFFPIIFFMSKVFNFKIHYFVIGGWLPKFLLKNRSIAKRLKRIERIYIETNQMKFDLNKLHKINNTVVFPNFRFKNKKKPSKVKNKNLKLVFMSRILKNKGIELIFNFANWTNIDLTIDFYGQIDPKVEDYFNSSVNDCSKISYKGHLQPEQINEVLSKYDLLMLPTKFYTEGLPGAIIDAYFAGIPVIVTRWLHAEEFVHHNKTGFIIPFEHGEDEFKNYIEKVNLDRNILDMMKLNAKKESLKYSAEAVWEIIKEIN